ncbi:hypothetical protein KI688_007287 [Linnemannia hyalina]|uniref:Crinkler effector protein N-terminal domain-containing protein n=1 Tax=Linnemannia hyalina TaxID=64524 RepID=A0A9P7XIW1_9FUNG|nr:hypothetical protein KI688_007287 [Linnemannia hyalina]
MGPFGRDIAADKLTLWRVSIPVADDNDDDDDDDLPIHLNNIPKDDKKKLKATRELRDVFGDEAAKNMIHIIVQRPPPVPARALTPPSDTSRPGTPLSGDLRADIKKIADRFFATGSAASDFLDAYVRGEFKLPVTTTGIKEGPTARRLEKSRIETESSLLGFTSPSVQSWRRCPREISIERAAGETGGHAIPGFTGVRRFRMRKNSIDVFLLVRELLTGHQYPNFTIGSKLRLVVDEAQILSDKGSSKFRSSYLETDPRPMLSPVLHGFRNAGGPKELTIIYCGTGLSIEGMLEIGRWDTAIDKTETVITS